MNDFSASLIICFYFLILTAQINTSYPTSYGSNMHDNEIDQLLSEFRLIHYKKEDKEKAYNHFQLLNSIFIQKYRELLVFFDNAPYSKSELYDRKKEMLEKFNAMSSAKCEMTCIVRFPRVNHFHALSVMAIQMQNEMYREVEYFLNNYFTWDDKIQ